MTIWLSFLLALGLHAVILLLPLFPGSPGLQDSGVRIELEFTQVPQPQAEQPKVVPDIDAPEPEPENVQEELKPPEPEPLKQLADAPVTEDTPELTQKAIEPAAPNIRKPLEQMDEAEKQHLASTLLSHRYIRHESVTEQVFGRPLVSEVQNPVPDFRLPARPSMIAMLDKPVPELPFAYQEGLVHFAYEPGLKGDLQRFWDVITPEIAFRTKYGTEVRCIWILVIGGCAWK